MTKNLYTKQLLSYKMLENLSDKQRKLYTVLLIAPILLVIIWLVYIKSTEQAGGIGKGNFLSPIDNSKLIVVLIIFLLVYVFFVGMIFFDNIKEFIISHVRR